MNYTKKRLAYIIFSAIAVLLTMGIIFYLSAQDGEKSSDTSGWLTDFIALIFGQAPNQDSLRTFAHFCEFAGLSFLVNNLFYAIKDKLRPLLCIILSWAYAWSDEIHQIFVPQRAFQLFDLTVDLGGIVSGALVYCTIIFLFKKIKIKNETKNHCLLENSKVKGIYLPFFNYFGILEYFIQFFDKGHNVIKCANSVVKHQCYR